MPGNKVLRNTILLTPKMWTNHGEQVSMKLPIIINEHGCLSFYKNTEDVCMNLEVIDVKNNEYIAYDSEGYQLQLATESHNEINPSLLGKIIGLGKPLKWRQETVVISDNENKEDQSIELKELLFIFLDRNFPTLAISRNNDLAYLIEEAVKVTGYEMQ